MGRTWDDLPDHEGYVLAELDRDGLPYTEDGRWCSSSTPETREATPTGRHRAACSCGWRGPISDTSVEDIFLPDHLNDFVLAEWDTHTAALRPLAELERVAANHADAVHALGYGVKMARKGGASWADIGAAVGITRQAAQQRWGNT